MKKINVIALNGTQQALEFEIGDNLMELLREAGYEEIIAMCGGCCSCATCHVKLAKQTDFQLAPMEEDEEILVSMADEYDPASSRLSCQISMGEAQNGLTVTLVAPE
jgi:2Fe-2S ferredoxin